MGNLVVMREGGDYPLVDAEVKLMPRFRVTWAQGSAPLVTSRVPNLQARGGTVIEMYAYSTRHRIHSRVNWRSYGGARN